VLVLGTGFMVFGLPYPVSKEFGGGIGLGGMADAGGFAIADGLASEEGAEDHFGMRMNGNARRARRVLASTRATQNRSALALNVKSLTLEV
jgi:hypothetical protein